MRDIEQELSEIRTMSRHPSRLGEAEERLSSLIDSLTPVELAESQGLLRSAIDGGYFLPKRQKKLSAKLSAALGSMLAEDRVTRNTPGSQSSVPVDALRVFRSDLHS